MRNFFSHKIKLFLKSLVVVGLILTLVLSQANTALAARSGGRIGGGSFRVPSRSFSAPSRGYGVPSRGYGYGGDWDFLSSFPSLPSGEDLVGCLPC
jgi:uncharacterized membrane protein